jgi:hypothetical protein
MSARNKTGNRRFPLVAQTNVTPAGKIKKKKIKFEKKKKNY